MLKMCQFPHFLTPPSPEPPPPSLDLAILTTESVSYSHRLWRFRTPVPSKCKISGYTVMIDGGSTVGETCRLVIV